MENEILFQFGPEPRTDAVARLVHELTSAGYSNTRARRAVLEALAVTRHPLNPNEILQAGRAYHPALGIVTVYRTLEMLQKLGLIARLHLKDGCHSYVLAGSGSESTDEREPARHGHHVICEACGRAVHFEGCDVDAVVTLVEDRTGFRVRHHWLELFGLCVECQAKEGS